MTSLDSRRHMSMLLIRAADATKQSFARAVDKRGLNATQARVVLALYEPRRMGDLAREIACDGSHITAIADHLGDLGYVERVQGTDRRVKLLSLTESGRKARADLGRLIADQEYPWDRLSQTARRKLEQLLVKLLGDD